jgi:hypothetical protein
VVLSGPRRINAVLTAVRGMVVHAVAVGEAPGYLVPLLYGVPDDRDLPDHLRREAVRMAWRLLCPRSTLGEGQERAECLVSDPRDWYRHTRPGSVGRSKPNWRVAQNAVGVRRARRAVR